MTETIDTAQPEALRLAAWLNEGAWLHMRLGDVEAAGRELRRLHSALAAAEARNATLTDDAARLDWLTFHLPGKALRDIGVVWAEHGDARRAIDAAMKEKTP